MGFIKKLFHLGGKKHKKKNSIDLLADSVPFEHTRQSEDQEAVASRLLRSSSRHLAASSSDFDYSSLPPIPHPVNNLLQVPTGSSSGTLSTRTSQSSLTVPGIERRSTYKVKIGQRVRHSSTDLSIIHNLPVPQVHVTPLSLRSKSHSTPLLSTLSDTPKPAKPQYPPITPRDQGRMHGLRQDPSVASLLQLYDEHGRLDSQVFSNTPGDGQGRAQTKRRGSTLRQLMGNPPSNSSRHTRDKSTNQSTFEGDISWAEQFLDEQPDSGSSTSSSYGLQTPKDEHSPTNPFHDANDAATIAAPDHDTSIASNVTSNDSKISSLEVELASSTDNSFGQSLSSPLRHFPLPPNCPYASPITAERASQVFGFLKDKDKDKDKERASARSSPLPPDIDDRPLPPLPRAVTPPGSRFSSDTSHDWSRVDTQSADTHATTAPPSSAYNRLSFFARPSLDSPCPPPRRESVVVYGHARARSQSTPAAEALYGQPTGASSELLHGQATGGSSDTQGTKLRGPRPPPAYAREQALEVKHDHRATRTVFGERSNGDVTQSHIPRAKSPQLPNSYRVPTKDRFTQLPPRAAHRRTSSRASKSSARSVVDYENEEYIAEFVAPTPRPSVEQQRKPVERQSVERTRRSVERTRNELFDPEPKVHLVKERGKENSGGARPRKGSRPQLPPIAPFTPIRTRSIFRPPKGKTPSPASSSELSPVGKDMMRNIRRKRVFKPDADGRTRRVPAVGSKLRYS